MIRIKFKNKIQKTCIGLLKKGKKTDKKEHSFVLLSNN